MEMPESRGQLIQLGLEALENRFGVYTTGRPRRLRILECIPFVVGIAEIPYVVLRANVNDFGQELK